MQEWVYMDCCLMMPHLLTMRNLSAVPLVATGRRTTSWAPIHWTLLHTNPFTHKPFYTHTILRTNALMQRGFYTQRLLHTEAFAHRTLLHADRFDTQKLLHTKTFTHKSFYTQNTFTHICFNTQTLLHTYALTHGSFYTQTLPHTDLHTHRREELRKNAWNQTLIIKPQFLAIEPHFVRKGSPDALQIAILPQFLAIEPHFVRKSCAGRFANRNFTAAFGDRTSFRVKELRRTRCKSQFYIIFWRSNLISCERVALDALQIAILPQFLAIEPHFVRKSCAGRFANRNFTAAFGDRTPFRAKRLRFVPSRWHCPAPSREK